MKDTFLFISWSGSKSKEISFVLKDFLSNVFGLSKEYIFFSEKDSYGEWYYTICRSISKSAIIIPCITKDNTHSPWLYFETGIGSFIRDDMTKKAVIPIVFDHTCNEIQNLPSPISHNHIVIQDVNDKSKEGFESILINLIFQIDRYILEHETELNADYNYVPHPIKFTGSDDKRIKCLYGDYIQQAVTKLMYLDQKYDKHDIFISRPIMGVKKSVSDWLDDTVKEITSSSNLKIYTSSEGVDFGSSISSYRISIIKQCQIFVLIYPKIEEPTQPSSCLIELGAALALGKKISIYIEKGANPPFFFHSLKEQIFLYEEFIGRNELKIKLELLTKSR